MRCFGKSRRLVHLFRSLTLARIAKAFESPRTRGSLSSLYSQLRGIKTLESDQISTEISLVQGQHKFVVEKSQGNAVHIQQTPTGVTVYVPRRKKNQGACFFTGLPHKLCEWLMEDPSTNIVDKVENDAVGAVMHALNAPLSSLCDVLVQGGIPDVESPADEEEYEEEEDDESEDEGVIGVADRLEPSNALPPRTPPSPIRFRNVPTTPEASPAARQGIFTDTESDPAETPRSSAPPSRQSRSREGPEAVYYTPSRAPVEPRPSLLEAPASINRQVPQVNDSTPYLDLLSKTIASARRAPLTLPSRYSMFIERPPVTPFRFVDNPKTSQLERDVKIGAAGELFVSRMVSYNAMTTPDDAFPFRFLNC
jgi:hypothetical protein